jgi:hypothetical protein
MAPPTAKARKQQVLHKFGDAGLCVETCTVVEEVPMADCFVVEDRLWVHKDGNEGCSVSANFQIRFIKGAVSSVPSIFLFYIDKLPLVCFLSSSFLKGTLFRRIIESTTRKEYAIFWNQFADMVRGLGNESQEEAIRLANAVLAEEEHEMPLSSAMNYMRMLSHRLSIVAKPQSNREGCRLEGAEDECGIYVQRTITFALDGVKYIRKQVSESDDAFIVVCVIFFMMMCLNIVVMRQLMMLSRFLQTMDVRLEKLDLNQAILLKLWSEKVSDGSCSS